MSDIWIEQNSKKVYNPEKVITQIGPGAIPRKKYNYDKLYKWRNQYFSDFQMKRLRTAISWINPEGIIKSNSGQTSPALFTLVEIEILIKPLDAFWIEGTKIHQIK
jgi:hypothetical protein